MLYENTLTIHLFIDDIERVIDYPIIDGNTILTNPNQLQLHKAELRGFVKCVAIHTGLGLSLWMKEENQLMETVEKKQDLITLPPLSDDRWNVAVQKIKSGEITRKR